MSTAPGWHPDPWSPPGTVLRWWDGVRWTDQCTRGAGTVPSVSSGSGLNVEDRRHLIEYYLGRYEFDWAHSWAPDNETYDPQMREQVLEAQFDALERHLPPDEPPLALNDRPHRLHRFLVLTARRVVLVDVIGAFDTAQHRIDEASEVFERLTLGSMAVLNHHERTPHGLKLNLDRRDRAWIEDFLAGPRQLQGRLRELLERPRRAPDAPRAGWFPDPSGQGKERFWDGTTWTEHVFLEDRALWPEGVYRRPLK